MATTNAIPILGHSTFEAAHTASFKANVFQIHHRKQRLLHLQRQPSPSHLGTPPLAGMGRGLEASRTLAAGDLLFISEPLAVIQQAGGANNDDGGAAPAAAAGSNGTGKSWEEMLEQDGEEEEGEGLDGADEAQEGAEGGEGAAYVPTDADVDALVAQLQVQRGAGAKVRGAWASGVLRCKG